MVNYLCQCCGAKHFGLVKFCPICGSDRISRLSTNTIADLHTDRLAKALRSPELDFSKADEDEGKDD